MAEAVTADWIVRALTKGRAAERVEAQRLLEDVDVNVDRAEVRRRLLDALNHSLAPDLSDTAEGAYFTRGWVLGALGRVPSAEGEPEQTLLKYVDGTYEPNLWNRYWALEALLPRDGRGTGRVKPSKSLLEACRKIAADRDEDRLPRTLARAILAGAGDQTDRERFVKSFNKDSDPGDRWAVLRALRFVYIPSAVQGLLDIVKYREENGRPSYGDITYDALVALSNLPPDSRLAEEAALELIKFIHSIRDFQFWDSFRMRAIESLGRLRHPHAPPLLVEEMADYNPAVAREAALALESIIGAKSAAMVILEEAAKVNGTDRGRLARGLREMRNRNAVIDALGAAMTSRDSDSQRHAQTLLSEVGGVTAFDKLRSLTKSTENYQQAMRESDDKLRNMFEHTMREARMGIAVVVGMDVVMFVVGVVLIGVAVTLALKEPDSFNAITSIVTGAGGVLSVIVGRFYAKPRERIQESVHYLTGVKAVFLGYLRQLRQTDQAYTRRVLEGTPLTTEEAGKFNDLVEATMTRAMTHLKEQ